MSAGNPAGNFRNARKVLENIEVALIEGKGKVNRCARCGSVFGPASKCFKYQVAVRETGYTQLALKGLMINPSDRFVVREFFCPSCGVLLDAESVMKGEPYLEIMLDTDS